MGTTSYEARFCLRYNTPYNARLIVFCACSPNSKMEQNRCDSLVCPLQTEKPKDSQRTICSVVTIHGQVYTSKQNLSTTFSDGGGGTHKNPFPGRTAEQTLVGVLITVGISATARSSRHVQARIPDVQHTHGTALPDGSQSLEVVALCHHQHG